MYGRDVLNNGKTEREDAMLVPIISIFLTTQPGEQPWEIIWEFSSTDRVRTIHMLDSGLCEVYFLKIMPSPCTDTWSFTGKYLSPYFIFSIPPEKQMDRGVPILCTGEHPSSLPVPMTDITNQSQHFPPCEIISEFSAQHSKQLPTIEQSWDVNGKLFAIPH